MTLAAIEQHRTTPAQSLRAVLAQGDLAVAPGCFDALSTKLAVLAGFRVLFMSGFAVSAARLGMPDTGLISFAEMLDTLRNCCTAADGVPVVGDADTGFGNALNVRRTVMEYARAGAACAMIEDQVSPKRCGHTPGKEVVSRGEARMRIRAAVEARAEAGTDILIMARTDARAVHGFDEALARCKEFAAEGADLIFLEAPETEDEMARFCSEVEAACVANMVPGGKTPILPRSQLQKIGYRLALYPVLSLSSAIAGMQTGLAALKNDDNATAPPTITFGELQKVVGFPDYWRRDALYRAND
jgi:2-methylisocitrate lyase-like PEP mutase family enzyme